MYVLIVDILKRKVVCGRWLEGVFNCDGRFVVKVSKNIWV